MTDQTLVVAVFNEAQHWSLPKESIERLRSALAPDVSVVAVQTRAQLVDRLDGATYLMGLPLIESQLAGRVDRLKFVQLVSAQAESLAPCQTVIDHGGRVAGTAVVRAVPVAEHAIALLLALLKRLDIAAQAQANHRWAAARIARRMGDLADATVGIVNLGVIGDAIAQRLASFGCELLATGENEAAAQHVDRLLGPANLDELVSRTDILVLADDPPGRTRSILDRAIFEAMRPRTLLVNVASGVAFAESELLRAMRNGHVAGAALDCYEHRPLAPNSPLWNASDVLLTPAVSAASPSYWRRAVDATIENIRRLESGQELLDELTVQPQAASA